MTTGKVDCQAIMTAEREGAYRVSKNEAMLPTGTLAFVERRRWVCPPGAGSRYRGIGPRESTAFVHTNTFSDTRDVWGSFCFKLHFYFHCFFVKCPYFADTNEFLDSSDCI